MNRGTVMETGNRRAVILTPDGQFVRVKLRREAAVGEEITWSQADAVSEGGRGIAHRRRWMSSAIAAAAFLVFMFGLWSFRTPPVVAYVSMDINPSVEFGLDAHERVRELRAVNADALPIIEGVEYKGKQIEIVMQILAQKLAASNILKAGGGEIVIASVRLRSVDVKWETEVTGKIEKVLLQTNAGMSGIASITPALDIEKVYLPVEVREEAKANGISSGKMAFWLAAESKGLEVPLSSLQDESLKKIASSWGGVKKVLHDQSASKEDKEEWKKLLSQKKDKKKNLSGQSPSPAGTDDQPAASSQPTPSIRPENDAGDDHGQDQSKGEDSKEQDHNIDKVKENNKGENKDQEKEKSKEKSKEKDREKDKDKSKDDGGKSQDQDQKKSDSRKSDEQDHSDDGKVDRSDSNSGKQNGKASEKERDKQRRDEHRDDNRDDNRDEHGGHGDD